MSWPEPEPPLAERPHEVYLIHDETGEVVYVGMSCNVDQRLYQHHFRYQHRWPYEPYTVERRSVPNREAARRLEVQLIDELQPRDNRHFRGYNRRAS